MSGEVQEMLWGGPAAESRQQFAEEQPASAECEYASYKSEVKFSDGVLHYQRTYEIKDLVVPTLKLAQVKRFFEQVGADESSAVALRRANP